MDNCPSSVLSIFPLSAKSETGRRNFSFWCKWYTNWLASHHLQNTSDTSAGSGGVYRMCWAGSRTAPAGRWCAAAWGSPRHRGCSSAWWRSRRSAPSAAAQNRTLVTTVAGGRVKRRAARRVGVERRRQIDRPSDRRRRRGGTAGWGCRRWWGRCPASAETPWPSWPCRSSGTRSRSAWWAEGTELRSTRLQVKHTHEERA